jgi:hypothetical protein
MPKRINRKDISADRSRITATTRKDDSNIFKLLNPEERQQKQRWLSKAETQTTAGTLQQQDTNNSVIASNNKDFRNSRFGFQKQRQNNSRDVARAGHQQQEHLQQQHGHQQ